MTLEVTASVRQRVIAQGIEVPPSALVIADNHLGTMKYVEAINVVSSLTILSRMSLRYRLTLSSQDELKTLYVVGRR